MNTALRWPAARMAEPPVASVSFGKERLTLKQAASYGTTQKDVVSISAALPHAFADLFTPSRYKAYYGGRGSAKSHSLASALVLRLAQKPMRCLCAREVQVSIRDSVKRLLDDKIDALHMRHLFKSTDAEIRGLNGSLIIFAGLRTDPYKIKSAEGIDLAWVEEANTVSQRSLDLLIPTIRGNEDELHAGLAGFDPDAEFREGDPEIWFSWNPDKDTDPVDRMFRSPSGPPPYSIMKKVSWTDNPWFPRVLRSELEHDFATDPDKARHIWEGEYWSRSDATVFKNWRVGDDLDFTPLPSTQFRFGGDWGFAIDPTVLVRCWLAEDEPEGWNLTRPRRRLYIDHEVYEIGCEIDDTPALFRTMPGSAEWPIIADSARPETISYMQRHGFPNMSPARKGPGSVEEGVKFLQGLDEIIIHPRCIHTINELKYYRYKLDPLTNKVLPILQDKKNHVIDALRYAFESFWLKTEFWVV